jgi:uncharacterized membrane protein YdjX (TVP38/TMEM64 family)
MRETLRAVLGSPALWLVTGLLLTAYLLVSWVDSVGGPEAIRERYGVMAPAITSSIQILVAPTPFPSDVICVAQGALYGFWFALGLNWLGWWLAAHIEFLLGRRLRGDFDLESRIGRLPRWLRRFPVEHPVFLIFARQVPWAGGHLTTLVPGAMGVPFIRSAWCNAIGIIPAAVLTAGVGAGLLAL